MKLIPMAPVISPYRSMTWSVLGFNNRKQTLPRLAVPPAVARQVAQSGSGKISHRDHPQNYPHGMCLLFIYPENPLVDSSLSLTGVVPTLGVRVAKVADAGQVLWIRRHV